MNKKIVLKESLVFFWLRLWVFVILIKCNFDFLFEVFAKFLDSYCLISLTNSAIDYLMTIKWTYLELSVDR